MAMFDLKDSDDVKIKDCHTKSETLVSGSGLNRLHVEGSRSGKKEISPVEKRAATAKCFSFVVRYAWQIVSGIIVAIVSTLILK